MFGTKKIYAKVTNGILLVRVGGGFMNGEEFFRLYGEQEFIKQQREEHKRKGTGEEFEYHGTPHHDGRVSIDSIPKAKKAAKQMKTNMRYNNQGHLKQRRGDDSSSNNGEFDNSNTFSDALGSQPGEYEINLMDDEDHDGSTTRSGHEN